MVTRGLKGVFEYIHEGGKNYLKTEEMVRGDYIGEMLIHNHINGFVDARLKSRNAESYVVYPVNGLIPLTQLVEIRKLKSDSVERLMTSLVKAYHGMEEFLLPFDRLIIDPEYIYQRKGKQEEFLWIYGGRETEKKGIISLFEYLLDKMDYTDDRAVNLIYTMYQTCKNLELFEEESGLDNLPLICEKAEDLLASKKTEMDKKVQEFMEKENHILIEYEAENKNRMYEREKEREENIEKESMVWERNRKNGKKQDKGFEKGKKNHKEVVKGVLKRAWNYLNADIGSEKQERAVVVEEAEECYKMREVKVVKQEERKKQGKDQTTTLLTNGLVHSGVYCLKSEEAGENSVLISSYPFFIGKGSEEVHLNLEDSTVSRFHARIDRTDEDFWITDLNSTNGTFLNGIRLIPYERLRLKRDDSIVIARKRYEFKYMS